MRARNLTCASITLTVVLLCQSVHSQLQVGFYGNSCGSAETIVKDEVRKGFYRDQGVAAGLVRLHFHDCFVKGCDGSVLIDSTPGNSAEKDSPANDPSLRGYEVIDSAKARLEAICKGVVSCADIVAIAARDSIVITGGLGYEVPAGRRDGRISLVSETFTNLPPPTLNVDQLTQAFAKKGFTQEEMVTLTGAHTIGRSHCTSFSERLYNFNGTTSQDPSLDPMYVAQLKQKFPQSSKNPNLVVPMNSDCPGFGDAGYYRGVLANRGLFTSDQTLLANAATANQVIKNARNPQAWRLKFPAAMLKMGPLDVLTGNAGEIRTNCRVINSKRERGMLHTHTTLEAKSWMLIVPVYVFIITRQAIMLRVFDSLNTKCECTVKHGTYLLPSSQLLASIHNLLNH